MEIIIQRYFITHEAIAQLVDMDIVICLDLLSTQFVDYLLVAWKYTETYNDPNLVAMHMMIHPLLQRKFQEMRGQYVMATKFTASIMVIMDDMN